MTSPYLAQLEAAYELAHASYLGSVASALLLRGLVEGSPGRDQDVYVILGGSEDFTEVLRRASKRASLGASPQRAGTYLSYEELNGLVESDPAGLGLAVRHSCLVLRGADLPKTFAGQSEQGLADGVRLSLVAAIARLFVEFSRQLDPRWTVEGWTDVVTGAVQLGLLRRTGGYFAHSEDVAAGARRVLGESGSRFVAAARPDMTYAELCAFGGLLFDQPATAVQAPDARLARSDVLRQPVSVRTWRSAWEEDLRIREPEISLIPLESSQGLPMPRSQAEGDRLRVFMPSWLGELVLLDLIPSAGAAFTLKARTGRARSRSAPRFAERRNARH